MDQGVIDRLTSMENRMSKPKAPEVDEEFVWTKVADLETELDNIIPGSSSVGYSILLRNFFVKMLLEAGVKVKED